MEDSHLIASQLRRCLAGDAAAWEEIVRTYNRRIYNICYRFTGSAEAAEDLTQEVFIKVYRTLGSYDGARGSFMTWVATLARNLLVDHFRRSKMDRATESMDASPSQDEEGLSLAAQLPDRSLSPDARLQQQETQQMVQNALGKLSPELREAVILRDLQDMDYREIAQALRVPEGTVKSRINRGRTELARLLARTYRQASG